MSKPSFSLHILFTALQNFVMMLTWKIFVTITCMVSLTHQMNPSIAGSSSGSSQFTDPGSPWLEDPQSERYYPHLHKSFNHFQPGTNAYNCYAFIRLYCGTKNGDVTSDDCAKNGILLYREIEMTFREMINNPHTWVYNFFKYFKLNPGKFQLPEQFCLAKDIKCRQIYRSCIRVLKNYTAKVLLPYMTPEGLAEPGEIEEIRLNIAWYAFHHRDLFVIQQEREAKNLTLEEDFETEYLIHISEHVSSDNPEHTPYNTCENEDILSVRHVFSDLLTKHLKLLKYQN